MIEELNGYPVTVAPPIVTVVVPVVINPVPFMVIGVPPAVVPELGETEMIVGAGASGAVYV